MTYWE